MTIKALSIDFVRNVSTIKCAPAAHINIFTGVNGSGKTSLLEAIYLLGMARSFRTHKIQHLIQNQAELARVQADIDLLNQGVSQSLGVERNLAGDIRLRYASTDIDLSALAELIPLQLIHADTFNLLDGAPSARRQYLDWGVFHADKAFIHLWRSFKRVLKQRNTLLKCGRIDPKIRQAWDKEFISCAEQINELRQAYIKLLTEEFNKVVTELLPSHKFSLMFSSGWDQKRSLDEVLEQNLARDMKQGFTSAGPQRADLQLKLGNQLAVERLSRGQKKLLVSALKLAQGALFSKMSGRSCIYLIDDLPAELDAKHSSLFCKFIEQTESQCFITCVDKTSLPYEWQPTTELKHYAVTDGSIELLAEA